MRKVIKWLFTVLGGLFTLGMAVSIIAYVLLFSVKTHDYAYATSPDKDLVATVTTDPGGYRYLVYVKNRNEIISLREQVAYIADPDLSQCARGVDVEWKSNSHLVIQFNNAKNVDIPNSKVRIGGRIITVEANLNHSNPAAPCSSPSLQLMNKGGGS